MRTYTNSGYNFEVPDYVACVFNPFLVKCYSSSNFAKLECNISAGLHVITFDAYNNECVADLREWMQSLYTSFAFSVDYSQQYDVSDLCKKNVQLILSAKDGNGSTVGYVTMTFDLVWGALNYGEPWDNTVREVTYFPHYPFSVGLYLGTISDLYVSVNGAPNYGIVNTSDRGILNVVISDPHGGRYMGVGELSNYVPDNVFDNTFDLTFSGGSGTYVEHVRIIVEDARYDEGYYLRWVDRRGMMCYYLFKSVSTSIKTTAGEMQRNNLYMWEQNYGFHNGAGRRLDYTRTDTIPVAAPLVSKTQWDALADLITSPVVDLYMGNDSNNVPQWMSVTVEAGTYTRTDEELQDFVLNIVKPSLTTQQL